MCYIKVNLNFPHEHAICICICNGRKQRFDGLNIAPLPAYNNYNCIFVQFLPQEFLFIFQPPQPLTKTSHLPRYSNTWVVYPSLVPLQLPIPSCSYFNLNFYCSIYIYIYVLRSYMRTNANFHSCMHGSIHSNHVALVYKAPFWKLRSHARVYI